MGQPLAVCTACLNQRSFVVSGTKAFRSRSGEVPAELESWWRAFQGADEESRRAMLLPDAGGQRRKRRRRRRGKKAPEGAPTPA